VPSSLAYDAASVGFNSANHSTTTASQASLSFTPPANSVIILNVEAIGNNTTATWVPPMTVTDSLASHLTWTVGPAQDGAASGGFATGMFTAWAAVGATSPGAMTATVTLEVDASHVIDFIAVQVDIWDGADTSGPFGADASGNPINTQNLSVSLTPTTTGSALVINLMDGDVAGAIAAGSGCYLYENTGGDSGGVLWVGTSSGPTLTTSLSPENLNVTMAKATSIPGYVAYEVLPQ
jgi:hypothetical protein